MNEKYFIASILVDNKSIKKTPYLKWEMLNDLECKLIYKKMIELDKVGSVINIATLSDDNIKTSSIFEIQSNTLEVVSGINIETYAKIIFDKARDKEIASAKNKNKIKEIEKKYEYEKKDKIQFHDFYDLLIEAKEINNNIDANDFVQYGLNFLDEKLGGISEGELVLLGGITNTGKTTLSFNIAKNVSNNGGKVIVVALEEKRTTKARKSIFYYCNGVRKTNGEKILQMPDYLTGKRKFTDKEMEEAIQYLANSIEIVGSDTSIGIDELEEIYSRGADLIVLDHLHYFGIDYKEDSKANAIEKAMQRIKELNLQYNTRTILIAHFSKLDETKRPTMTNFKDSISIAQTVDTVIMLWRDKSLSDDPYLQYYTEFIVPKNRIDVPSFTATSFFDIKTNQYVDTVKYSNGTQNSTYQNNQRSNQVSL